MATKARGGLDGGVGNGVPLPEGKKRAGDDEDLDELPLDETPEFDEFELEHDDAEPSDRRRDPLRKPGT
jgi:hypothetical protein